MKSSLEAKITFGILIVGILCLGAYIVNVFNPKPSEQIVVTVTPNEIYVNQNPPSFFTVKVKSEKSVNVSSVLFEGVSFEGAEPPTILGSTVFTFNGQIIYNIVISKAFHMGVTLLPKDVEVALTGSFSDGSSFHAEAVITIFSSSGELHEILWNLERK